MKTLLQVKNNNLKLALNGITFVNPFFRKLTDQKPYDIKQITVDKKNIEKKLQKIIKKYSEPLVVIVRDDRYELEDVFFIPPKNINDLYRKP